MKLFIIAALIAVAAAGRLEHLERSYLPPDNSLPHSGGFDAQNSFGSPSSRGSQGFNNHGSNGNFGAHASANAYSNGFDQGSNGFGSHAQGSNGLGSHGSNGFGSNGLGSNGVLNAADLKQYLPPNQPSSGSLSGFPGSSIKPACSSCGFARQQYSQSQYPQIPSAQYGQPQFGVAANANGLNSGAFGSQGSLGSPSSHGSQSSFGSHSSHGSPSSFGSHSSHGSPSSFGSQSSFGQDSALNRQYLAPKSQEIPQQPFDEQTGYHY